MRRAVACSVQERATIEEHQDRAEKEKKVTTKVTGERERESSSCNRTRDIFYSKGKGGDTTVKEHDTEQENI